MLFELHIKAKFEIKNLGCLVQKNLLYTEIQTFLLVVTRKYLVQIRIFVFWFLVSVKGSILKIPLPEL